MMVRNSETDCKRVHQVERPLPSVTTDPKTGKNVVPPSAALAQWKTWSYGEYYQDCRLAARAMVALGLQAFDGVNIYGFNSPEWVMAQLSGIMAGGIAAGIYPSDTPEQVMYKSKHSSASIAVVESEKQLKIFLDNKVACMFVFVRAF